MTPEDAMERGNVVMAHAWMVRQFLKHAEEAQDHEDVLDVHRTIFDAIRALEPSYQKRDAAEYLRRLRGKLPKLRRASETLAREWSQVSSHTNFEMAARSLAGCVHHVEEILAAAGPVRPAQPQAPDPPPGPGSAP